jgi:hypothetical protein
MASSHHAVEVSPRRATRVNNFASFFKNYMSVSSVVVASLPIPVTSLNLIKTYSAQTKMLSVYTSLFCFLILGFVFFSRHALGRAMFAGVWGPSSAKKSTVSFLVGTLPLLLIIGSIVMVFSYHSLLSESLVVAEAQAQAKAQGGQLAGAYLYDMDFAVNRAAEMDLAYEFLSDRSILASAVGSPTLKDVATSVATREAGRSHGDTARASKELIEHLNLSKSTPTTGPASKAPETESAPTQTTPAQAEIDSYTGNLRPLKLDPASEFPLEAIPWSMPLAAYYVGIFAFAEAAFVLMALKEYLLDLLHLSDSFLITGTEPGAEEPPPPTPA